MLGMMSTADKGDLLAALGHLRGSLALVELEARFGPGRDNGMEPEIFAGAMAGVGSGGVKVAVCPPIPQPRKRSPSPQGGRWDVSSTAVKDRTENPSLLPTHVRTRFSKMIILLKPDSMWNLQSRGADGIAGVTGKLDPISLGDDRQCRMVRLPRSPWSLEDPPRVSCRCVCSCSSRLCPAVWLASAWMMASCECGGAEAETRSGWPTPSR